MGLRKFSIRESASRPLRTVLTLMSIAIGVGAVIAVLLSITTNRSAQKELLQAMSGRADVEVISNSEDGFEYDVIKQVRARTEVDVAAPLLENLSVMFVGERRVTLQVFGIDPRVDAGVRDYTVEGQAPKSLKEAMLSQSLANSLGVKIGDEVRMLSRGGLKSFEVSGLVVPNASGLVSLSTAAYLVLPASQRLLSRGNQIDRIQIILKPDVADVDELILQMQAALPGNVTVQRPQQRNRVAEETMGGTENALLMLITFALLIAIFIIYNAFEMSVGERRRQFGILRAIGATRWQITRTVLSEALWISVLGSGMGCLLGIWGSGVLNMATQSLLQVRLAPPQLSIWPFAVALPVGILVSLLGALLPARGASLVSPVEAMRRTGASSSKGLVAIAKVIVPAGFAIGLFFLVGAIGFHWFVGADVVGIVFVLIALIALLPMTLEHCVMAIARCLRGFGVESRLAANQLLRHVGRTTLTAGVLFLACATSNGVAGNILDNVDDVRGWYQRTIIGDFFLRASMPQLATGKSADLPANIRREIEQIEGVKSLDSLRFVSVQSDGDSLLAVVREFKGGSADFFDLIEGDANSAFQGVREGKTVIGSVLAQRRGLKVGDKLAFESTQGTHQVEVAAITNEYFGGGLTFYLDRKLAEEQLDVSGVDAFVITAVETQQESVGQELGTLAKREGLLLQSNSELKGFIDGITQNVIASLWMLMSLGCIIAALGLVNTLTMNILEQTREIGMLRTIAMTRWQIRKMIIFQSVILGAIAILPGCLAGSAIAYIASFSAYEVLGHHVAFHFRPNLILLSVCVSTLVILLSSLIPAERAARLPLAAAVQHE